MNLEQQVCSLDLGKRLCELGVKQESYFYYHADSHKLWTNSHPDGESYSAFTSAELGNMLPYSLDKSASASDLRDLKITKNPQSEWICYYVSHRTGSCLPWTEDINLSNAMAKMLINLLENELI